MIKKKRLKNFIYEKNDLAFNGFSQNEIKKIEELNNLLTKRKKPATLKSADERKRYK